MGKNPFFHLHGKAKKGGKGIFGGHFGGRVIERRGYRCKFGGGSFAGGNFLNEFLMFDFGKGIKLFH